MQSGSSIQEKVLHFDSAHEAREIVGTSHRRLDRLAERLGVQLTTRDTWLRIAGEAENIDKAVRFVESMRRARNAGVALRDRDLEYGLAALQSGQSADWDKLASCRIQVGLGKPPVFPRTAGQLRYVEAIRDNDIAFGIGPAGTGKTYLAMAIAVSTLIAGDVSRIILTRPAIEAGEALGFLPGDMHQKVLPYLRPLYDALYDMMPAEEIEKNLERGIIEVAPLAYMRGRTLNHAFIILDEAQNTTPEQMLMFLTRMGFDSKCVITGDPTQVDLPAGRASGLVEARRALRDIEGIVIHELDENDVIRHELVQKIIQAYRRERPAQTDGGSPRRTARGTDS